MDAVWNIALPAVLSFLLSALLLKLFIPILRKVKLGQKILEIGPSWHKSKEGTPVLGGLFFLLSTAAAFACWLLYSKSGWNAQLGGIALLALLSGMTGFVDDYVKLFKKRNKGLTAKQKMLLQFVTAGLFLAYRRAFCRSGTTVCLYGLFGMEELDLHGFYYLLMLFVIVYAINCANLTDGIDGLLGSVSLIQCVFLLCVTNTLLPDAAMSALYASLAGGLLGFLVFNFHPAKIFMGDTGSLFLGGFVTAAVFTLHMEVLLLPICFIWIVEGLSVVLQVLSFKLTGKRILKMAPIHHHFELCHWSEVRVVFTFSLLSALTCGAAYAVLALH